MKSMIKKWGKKVECPSIKQHGQNRGPFSYPIWYFFITTWQMPPQAPSELCLRWWTKPCWPLVLLWVCVCVRVSTHTCDALISTCVGEYTHDTLISMCVGEHTHDALISMSMREHTHDALISICVCEHTHSTLISMHVGEHTHDTLISICVCEHTHGALIPVSVSAPMILCSQCVCVSTSMTLWSQCNFEERVTNDADRCLLILLPHQINLFLQSKWC